MHDRPLGRKAALVAHPRFLGHHVDADASHPRRGPGEILVDEILREADGFEDLRAVIALDGADAHLGDDFDDAFGDGFQILLFR